MSSGRSANADEVVHGEFTVTSTAPNLSKAPVAYARPAYDAYPLVESTQRKTAMAKTDPVTGAKVHAYLMEKGVETPMLQLARGAAPDNAQKKATIEHHFAAIMQTLGLDLKDDSLQDTPARVAKMYVDEIFYGLDYNNFPKITVVDNKMHYDEMVMEGDVSVQSNCEHHFVIIAGKAAVAYMPAGKVLGLSKINRLVEFFAKRPQIQERLTEQVYHAMVCLLDTEDVAVLINAQHYCVKSRGVRDEGSFTVTSRLGGRFHDPGLRSEFLAFARMTAR